MVEAKITLSQPSRNQCQFVVRTGGGHALVIDDEQGATGPKPIELMAAGLGGCSAFDVISVLRSMRQLVTDYEVRVQADQVGVPPDLFTQIQVRHIVTGIEIDSKAVESAIRFSEQKYCSVHAMIGKLAKITTSYEILEDGWDEQADSVLSGFLPDKPPIPE